MTGVTVEFGMIEQRLRIDQPLIAMVRLAPFAQAPGVRKLGLGAVAEVVEVAKLDGVEAIRQHHEAMFLEKLRGRVDVGGGIKGGRRLAADPTESLPGEPRIPAGVLLRLQSHLHRRLASSPS